MPLQFADVCHLHYLLEGVFGGWQQVALQQGKVHSRSAEYRTAQSSTWQCKSVQYSAVQAVRKAAFSRALQQT
jgi:hypothetical protein